MRVFLAPYGDEENLLSILCLNINMFSSPLPPLTGPASGAKLARGGYPASVYREWKCDVFEGEKVEINLPSLK